jgi:hypothetical protein
MAQYQKITSHLGFLPPMFTENYAKLPRVATTAHVLGVVRAETARVLEPPGHSSHGGGKSKFS